MSAAPRDLRIDLIMRLEDEHSVTMIASAESSQGERWKCRCGLHLKGDGALKQGREHRIVTLLAGLDEALAIA